ncbi:MAG: hypothetical protein IJN29_14960 [Akkermansia sp.]|nr:hypothetical protein [Akkermansia sp.]
METDTTNINTEPNTEPLSPSSEHGTETPAQSNPAKATPEIPEYSKEAAAALNAAYSLTEPAADTPSSEPETEAPDNTATDYTLTFPDTFADHPEAQAFNTLLSPIAKQSGLDGTTFGNLFASAYAAIEDARQRAEWQNRFQQDIDLKKDWGADYETNMNTARSHIAFLKEKAGLTDDDLAVFASPKGMRALYAMATAHTPPPAAGLLPNTHSEQNWAKAIMQPDHPDHDAFVNPMNPRYKDINQRWLRANGH